MEQVFMGEFSDEYQDWLDGHDPRPSDDWLNIPVRDLASDGVLTAAPSDTVRETARAMSALSCGAVLVLDQGDLIGIFTERDLCGRVVSAGLDPDRTKVHEVMTRHPTTILESDSMGQALRVLVLGGYRHLPVVDVAGAPVNVVSVRRIVEHIAERFPSQVFNAPLDSQPPHAPTLDGG